jgi:hypothetical protein
MHTTVALRDGQTALFGGLVKAGKQKISDEINGKVTEREEEVKRTLYFMLTARLAKEDGKPAKAPPDQPQSSREPAPSPEDRTAPSPSSGGNLPYGVAVEGKPGYITSPYAPHSGYVDVRGFPSGTEVKCPYTGKLFRIP